MDATTKIAVILSAFDKMSPIINQATDNAEKKMKKLMQKNFVEGGAMMAMGIGLIKKIEGPAVSAYAKLEEANADLMASMMDSTGAIDANFTKISALAEGLGDKLPGTTADFFELFKTMMQNGVKSENILNGIGKAASYLAVDLKMPYAAAGEFAARMKEATGVADEEMLKFMDTVSRLNSLGIGADEMRYAFARSSGSLKLLGLQGLQASNDMGVLYAQLIRIAGMSGETAGTSFNNIIQALLDEKKFSKFNNEAKKLGVSMEFFKDGKFLGVENMVAQFDKLSKFDVNKRASLVQLLTGGGQDAQALNTIISQGSAGYAKLRSEMEKKATLNDKVNIKLKTLNQLWEATTGTIQNMLAALGAGLAPVLKPIVEMIGSIAAKIKEWLSANPAMAKFISMLITAAGVALTLAGVVKIIAGIRIAMQLLNITLKANPIILIATAIILLASLIYAKWDKIREFFIRLWTGIKNFFGKIWDGIKSVFRSAINGIKYYLWNFTPLAIIKHWSSIVAWFKGVWDRIKKAAVEVWGNIKQVIVAPIEWIKEKWNQLGNWFKNLFDKIGGWAKKAWGWIKDRFRSPADMMIEKLAKDNPELQKQMQKMAQTVDDYLPHSPAKKGPLSRLNKLRIVETIAENIKVPPIAERMKNLSSVAFNAIAKTPSSAPALQGVGRSAGSNSFSFEINVNGGATKEDAKKVMDEIEKRLPSLLKRYQGNQERVSFS